MDDEQMSEKLRFTLNHVFMPPKLPQADEQDDYYDKEHYLCRVALESCKQFVGHLPAEDQPEGQRIVRAIEQYSDFNGPTPFDPTDLSRVLAQMEIGGTFYSSHPKSL